MVSYRSNNTFVLSGLSSLSFLVVLLVFGLLSATLVSAQNYVIGTYGTAACSAGDPILDEDECRDAAPALGQICYICTTGFVSNDYSPGCMTYVNVGGNRQEFYFNTNLDSTGSDPEYAPICKIPVSTAGGDPHFQLFHSQYITFQGACDVLLSNSPDGADGLPFRIHARLTTPSDQNRSKDSEKYTFISEVGLEIGPELKFQVQSENATVLLNDKHFTSAEDDVDESTTKGFSFAFSKEVKGQRKNIVAYTFTFANNSKIVIRSNTHFRMTFVELHGSFGNSSVSGLLGNPKTKGLFNRKGELMSADDVNAYGIEWQVRADEPKLFVNKDRFPQYPDKCVIVNTKEEMTNLRGDKSSIGRRRLLAEEADDDVDKNKLVQDAIKACSHLKGIGNQFCVEDIIATGQFELASESFYTGMY